MVWTALKSGLLFQDDNSTGRVGPPLQGVQVKLIDWEEGNYRVTDLPHPRGSLEAARPLPLLILSWNLVKTELKDCSSPSSVSCRVFEPLSSDTKFKFHLQLPDIHLNNLRNLLSPRVVYDEKIEVSVIVVTDSSIFVALPGIRKGGTLVRLYLF